MSADELKKSIEEKHAEMSSAEKDLEEPLKSFQAQYEAGQKQRDDTKKHQRGRPRHDEDRRRAQEDREAGALSGAGPPPCDACGEHLLRSYGGVSAPSATLFFVPAFAAHSFGPSS